MTHTLQNFKLFTLAVAVLMGAAINCSRADAAGKETAIVAGGCFWCVESDFESVPGVIEAVSGYTGGTVKNPTYRQVTRGRTGHYEAVKITYDPAKVSYAEIIRLFFRSVDPTDAGGQFCDRGDTYRSAVFVANPSQKAEAEAAKAEAAKILDKKIATRILPAAIFYDAEAVHQNFYKGKRVVLTRYGLKRQSKAYRAYRKSCGRDARVRQLWGSAAVFARN